MSSSIEGFAPLRRKQKLCFKWLKRASIPGCCRPRSNVLIHSYALRRMEVYVITSSLCHLVPAGFTFLHVQISNWSQLNSALAADAALPHIIISCYFIHYSTFEANMWVFAWECANANRVTNSLEILWKTFLWIWLGDENLFRWSWQRSKIRITQIFGRSLATEVCVAPGEYTPSVVISNYYSLHQFNKILGWKTVAEKAGFAAVSEFFCIALSISTCFCKVSGIYHLN